MQLRNLEFIQYYPTTVQRGNKRVIISESVRSEGWRLYYKNRSHSVYFMEEKYGTEGNLMSRDLVAREIAMCPGQVYLENAKESIPVTPAIHFFMGGIKVDGMHQTNIAGLYAVGEAASKYHGANCLGGNSLMTAVHSGRTAAHAVHEDRVSRCAKNCLFLILSMSRRKLIVWNRCQSIGASIQRQQHCVN